MAVASVASDALTCGNHPSSGTKGANRRIAITEITANTSANTSDSSMTLWILNELGETEEVFGNIYSRETKQ